jgi:anaerobic dimethyl sulfoxide reductase subunit A
MPGVTQVLHMPVTRRNFVKWSAAAGGAEVVVGAGARYGLLPIAQRRPPRQQPTPAPRSSGRHATSTVDRGAPLRLTVVDGTVTRVDPADGASHGPQG